MDSGQRIEIASEGQLLRTAPRRRLVTWGLTALSALLVVWNLSPTVIREPFQEAVGPIMRVTRVQQSWAYFAPEVGLVSTEAWVEIERTDGTTEVWDITPDAPVLQTLRTYRWIKFEEALFADETLWMPALEYASRNAPDPSSIARVHLIGAETAPTEGIAGPFDPAWESTVLATLEVRDQ